MFVDPRRDGTPGDHASVLQCVDRYDELLLDILPDRVHSAKDAAELFASWPIRTARCCR